MSRLETLAAVSVEVSPSSSRRLPCKRMRSLEAEACLPSPSTMCTPNKKLASSENEAQGEEANEPELSFIAWQPRSADMEDEATSSPAGQQFSTASKRGRGSSSPCSLPPCPEEAGSHHEDDSSGASSEDSRFSAGWEEQQHQCQHPHQHHHQHHRHHQHEQHPRGFSSGLGSPFQQSVVSS